jgi:hypothetical protein
MSFIQKFVSAVLPKSWFDAMEKDSQRGEYTANVDTAIRYGISAARSARTQARRIGEESTRSADRNRGR